MRIGTLHEETPERKDATRKTGVYRVSRLVDRSYYERIYVTRSRRMGWWWQFNPNFGVRRSGTQPAKPHAWFLPLFAPRRMTDRPTDRSYCYRRSPSQSFRGMRAECLRNARERTTRNLLPLDSPKQKPQLRNVFSVIQLLNLWEQINAIIRKSLNGAKCGVI